jgi:hypothetical protein
MNKQFINIIALSALVTGITPRLSWADDMVILKEGDTAPMDGILVSGERMKEFRKTNEDYKLLKLENLKLKDLGVIHEQRIDLYKDQVKRVTEDLSSSERRRFWTNLGYFALGVVVTGFAAKVAIEAGR